MPKAKSPGRQSKRKKKSHKKHDVARHNKSDKRVDKKKDSKLRGRSKKSKKRGRSSKRNKTPRKKTGDKHRGKSKKSMKSAKHKKHGPESSKKSKKSAKKQKRSKVKSSSKRKHKDKPSKGSKGKKEGGDRKRKRSKVKKQEERERAEKRKRDEQKNWIAEEFLQSPDAAAKQKEEEKKPEEKPSQFMDTQRGTLESQKKKMGPSPKQKGGSGDRIQGLEDENVPTYPPTQPESSKRKEPGQPYMALPPMPSEQLPPPAAPGAPPATALAQLREQEVAAASVSPDAKAKPSPSPKPRAQELFPTEEPRPAKDTSQGISASDRRAKAPPPPAEARPSPAMEARAAPSPEPFMKTAKEVSPIQTAQAAPMPQDSPPPPPVPIPTPPPQPPQPRPKAELPPYFAAPVIAPKPEKERKERSAGRRAPRPDDKIYGLGPEAPPTPPQAGAAQYFVPEQQRVPEAPYGAAPSPMVPPPRETEVPVQQEIRTAREFKPSPRERAPSDDRLRVNIDEILRLGAIMERRHLSPKKKMSFEWIALNRHLIDQQPEAFSAHLVMAVGDVRMEKSLACDALNVLMYEHTITPDEYLRLCQHLETVNPITVGTLAQLLRSNTQYYSNLPNFQFCQRQPAQP